MGCAGTATGGASWSGGGRVDRRRAVTGIVPGVSSLGLTDEEGDVRPDGAGPALRRRRAIMGFVETQIDGGSGLTLSWMRKSLSSLIQAPIHLLRPGLRSSSEVRYPRMSDAFAKVLRLRADKADRKYL